MVTQPDSDHARLSDADVAEVMRLLRGVDSVELKTTIPVGAQRATVLGLPLDPVEARPRQVFFFDTPDLALDAAGVVVRARRIQGGRGDTVVKLRPAEPMDLPADVRRSAGFNVELDALPGGFICSASFKGRCSGQEISDVVSGAMPLRKLLAKEQRAFYSQHAPSDIGLDALIPLGPIFLLKAVFDADLSGQPGALEQRMVAELWLYPDGSRILELSTRCPPPAAFQVATEMRNYLVERGVPVTGGQQTKTRAAMAFFRTEFETEAGA